MWGLLGGRENSIERFARKGLDLDAGSLRASYRQRVTAETNLDGVTHGSAADHPHFGAW